MRKLLSLALLAGSCTYAQVTLTGAASPASAEPGSTVVTLTGTAFPTGTILPAQVSVRLEPSLAGSNPVITVGALGVQKVLGSTNRITFSVPTTVVVSAAAQYKVSVSGTTSSGAAFSSLNTSLLTIQPTAGILDATPLAMKPGDSAAVLIHTQFASFVQGAATASLGTGISVGDLPVGAAVPDPAAFGATGKVIVVDGNTILALVRVSADATPGVRDLTLQQSAATYKKPAALTIQSNVPANASTSIAALGAAPSPQAGTPGITTFTMTASGLPAGTISPDQMRLFLEPGIDANSSPSFSLTPLSIGDDTGGSRTITFQVPASVVLNAPTSYLLTLYGSTSGYGESLAGTTFLSGNRASLQLGPASFSPSLTSVSPASGQQAQTLAVTISGSAFSPDVTIDAGAGITVSGISLLGSTTIKCTFAIDPAALLGPHDITVNLGTQSVRATGLFTVNPVGGPPPVITSISPTAMSVGDSATITVVGQNTHFTQDHTVLDFGQGITVNNITVTTGTSLTAQVSVDSGAGGGPRNVSAATNSELAMLPNGLTLLGPAIAISSPDNETYSNQTAITVSGIVSDPNSTVKVNGIFAPSQNGNFTVAVPLKEGINRINAVAIASGGAASSASIQVFLDTTPPRLAITSPTAEQEVTTDRITVSGIVNDLVFGTVNGENAHVAVNGKSAIVANRTFVAFDVPLDIGTNTIHVQATDKVGNTSTSSLTVVRTYAPLVQITAVSGANQSGAIGAPLPSPLVVKLTDRFGSPLTGKAVTFQVTGNDCGLSQSSGDSPKSTVTVQTDSEGLARAIWTLGHRVGAGNNQVEAFATGVTAPATFSASGTAGPAASILIDSGQNQTATSGDTLPLPFVVVVTDVGHNRLSGVPVTFKVTNGRGTIDGQSEKTIATDVDGRASIYLRVGNNPGPSSNMVVASFPDDSTTAVGFVASSLAAQSTQDTEVAGVVLDNAGNPISGVTMRLYQLNDGPRTNLPLQVAPSALTDSMGQFTIPQAPVGLYKLMADGTTATGTKRFPTLEYDINTISGQIVTLGMPIYLPALDTANQLCVTSAVGGTLTLPSVPGFSLTVQPGSATFPGGSKTGCITATPVNLDKIPMGPGFGQQPRFVATIQPVGTAFSPPAALTIPNVDGLKPHEITEMYSYDHDLAAFVTIGTGTVSADGSLIQSDPGVGVIKAGWHCGGNPSQTGNAAKCPTCKSCQGPGCAPDDGQPYDDHKYCTSCDGKAPGPDCCKSGKPTANKWPEDTVSAKHKLVDGSIDELLAEIEEVEEFSPCQLNPIVEFNTYVSVQEKCCESVKAARPVAEAGGEVTVGASVACTLGPRIPFVGGVYAEIKGSLSGNVEVSGTIADNSIAGFSCADCDAEAKMSVSLGLSGSVHAELGDVSADLTVKADAFTVSSSYDLCEKKLERPQGCFGPITIEGKVTISYLFELSVDYTLVDKRCL